MRLSQTGLSTPDHVSGLQIFEMTPSPKPADTLRTGLSLIIQNLFQNFEMKVNQQEGSRKQGFLSPGCYPAPRRLSGWLDI
jgi:hypothetical protein